MPPPEQLASTSDWHNSPPPRSRPPAPPVKPPPPPYFIPMPPSAASVAREKHRLSIIAGVGLGGPVLVGVLWGVVTREGAAMRAERRRLMVEAELRAWRRSAPACAEEAAAVSVDNYP